MDAQQTLETWSKAMRQWHLTKEPRWFELAYVNAEMLQALMDAKHVTPDFTAIGVTLELFSEWLKEAQEFVAHMRRHNTAVAKLAEQCVID